MFFQCMVLLWIVALLPLSSLGDFLANVTSGIDQDCGKIRIRSHELRIVGGAPTEFGKWPWQVSIRFKHRYASTSIHQHGGALLSTLWVITAAHHISKISPKILSVRTGEHELTTEKETLFQYEDHNVESVIVHPDFKLAIFENDLAIIKLTMAIATNDYVQPVCLPPGDAVPDQATITGWGKTQASNDDHSNVLQSVTVPIINNSECESMFLKAGYHEKIPQSFICAGEKEGGKDSCQGDSGGPMVAQRQSGEWEIIGIVSWGIGCGQAGLPGVLIRISAYLQWIQNIIYSNKPQN